eukprot:1161717-Pelagomonas_calceolata.AAC.11
MARVDAQGKPQGDEVDVDARPSDAINFAIRAGVRLLGVVGVNLANRLSSLAGAKIPSRSRQMLGLASSQQPGAPHPHKMRTCVCRMRFIRAGCPAGTPLQESVSCTHRALGRILEVANLHPQICACAYISMYMNGNAALADFRACRPPCLSAEKVTLTAIMQDPSILQSALLMTVHACWPNVNVSTNIAEWLALTAEMPVTPHV